MSAQIIWPDLTTFSRPPSPQPHSSSGEDGRPFEAADPERLWAFDRRRAVVMAAFLALPESSTSVLERWVLGLCEQTAEFGAHLRRVADLAVEIAGELRLPPDMVRDVERAGLLHDVGLLCIPGALASRTTRPSSTSLELVRHHPEIAFDFVSQRPGYETVGDIVRATKEHFDGTGAPRGLGGRDIPIGARIVAVAEALDSQLTPWAWGEARSLVEAVTVLVRGAGSTFDPDVVAACIRVLDAHEGRVQ